MDKEKSIEIVKKYLKNFEGKKEEFEAILYLLNECVKNKKKEKLKWKKKNI